MYGKKLKSIRKKLDVTQEKMAEILGISARAYASYERSENNPPYSMLVSLCNIHNVNLNWFIADIGEMFNAPKYEDVKDELKTQVLNILKEQGLIK